MSILHYFSHDENKRAEFIFDLIAPMYGMADKGLQKSYQQAMEILKNEILLKKQTVLDLGTGTGAWAAMFLNYQAAHVHGVDISQKMLHQSRKKHPGVTFAKDNIEKLTSIENDAFDIVTASYVIHGAQSDRRMKIIAEMKRVSKRYVVIHDFLGRTPLVVQFVEWVEKSDYKQFKKMIVDELKTQFSEVKRIPIQRGSGLYLAIK